MNDDLALLHEYVRHQSGDAFAAIVSRHVNFVYSVALRQVRDPQMAEEVTQAVFIILARKAHSIDGKTILSGWLCRTARYASANALTIQRRRQRHEKEAFMQMQLDQPDVSCRPEMEAETWNQIAPLLDAGMGKLGRKDHDALVLRFFENKSFVEVGTALGASEEAAKKRVHRALEKLRTFFGRQGVSSTATILGGAISVNSVQAAPLILAKSVTAVATVKGAAASATALTLANGVLKFMARAKMKMAMAVALVILFGTGLGALLLQEQRIWDEEWGIRANLNTGNVPPEMQRKLEARYAALRERDYQVRAQRLVYNLFGRPVPSVSARYQEFSLQLSSYATVHFESDKPMVIYSGMGYELAAINDLPTADILSFCRRQYGALWDIRFADDLMDVLADMNHPINADHTVAVTLVDPRTGRRNTVGHVPVTKVNRKDIVEALHPETNGWSPANLYR